MSVSGGRPARRAEGQPLTLPDLTFPMAESRTLRTVLGRYLRRLYDDLLAIPVRLVAPADRGLFSSTMGQMRQVAARNRSAALALLRPPTINGLIATARRQAFAGGDLEAMSGWLRELCLLLLVDLARQGELTQAVRWQADDRPPPRLCCPGAGIAIEFTKPLSTLTFETGRMIAETGQGRWALDLSQPPQTAPPEAPWRLTRPYHAIVPGVWLAEVDNNPLSDFEAHPDKQGNQLDLGGQPMTAWVDALRAAFGLIDQFLPRLGAELRLVATLLVPVGYDAERHLSASYQEVVGTAYLTLHPDVMTMTEAVVHEFQHNKLNAAMHLDQLLHNAFSPLFSSPVRPDPRPLHGIVLAVHAFQPVALLYRAMADAGDPRAANPSWQRRFAGIVAGNRDGARTVLENGQPTIAGAQLLAEMRALDEQARDWGEA